MDEYEDLLYDGPETDDSYHRLDPRRFISPAVGEMGLPDPVADRAMGYGAELLGDTKWWSGRSPRIMAAACIYAAASDENADVTQADVAVQLDTSVSSIKDAYPVVVERYDPTGDA